MRRLDYWIALNVIVVTICFAWASLSSFKSTIAAAEVSSASASLEIAPLRPSVP